MKRLDVGNIKIMLQLMINKSKNIETMTFLKIVLDLIQSEEYEINKLKQKLNIPD